MIDIDIGCQSIHLYCV